MKVGELIVRLQEFPEYADVRVEIPEGDADMALPTVASAESVTPGDSMSVVVISACK